MSARLQGLLITTIGMLLIVPDSLFVRLIDADPLVTAFWRGLTSGSLILVLVLVSRGRLGRFRDLPKTGRSGLIYALFIGSTTIGFVMAISNTSVANAVLILATLPMFSAVFSWLFLGEGIGRRILWTMAAVLLGLAVIA